MMRLTKRQSRLAGFLMLLLFFVFAIAFTSTEKFSGGETVALIEPSVDDSLPSESPTGENQTTSKELPDAAEQPATQQGVVALQDFHRSETRDGKVVWEVWGSDATFSPDTNVVTIHSAKLLFRNKQDELIELTAGKAILIIEGPRLSHADASQGVKMVHNSKVTVIAPTASYDAEKSVVMADGPVEITHRLITINGYDLIAHIDTQELLLGREVTSTVKPANTADKG